MVVKQMRFGSFFTEYISIPHRNQTIILWTEQPIVQFNGMSQIVYPVYSFTVKNSSQFFYDDSFSPKQPENDITSIIYKVVSSTSKSIFAIRIFNNIDITPILNKLNIDVVDCYKSAQLNKEFMVYLCSR